MARINPTTTDNRDASASKMLEGVEKKLGMVPNMMSSIAHSSASLGAYLQAGQALAGGKLPQPIQEQIALAVAGANGCEYCASAHTLLAGGAGVDGDEAQRNLSGRSQDGKTQAALTFALAVVEKRGRVSEADLTAVRDAGYSDGEIVEIISAVGHNVFTNYFNNAVRTEIDFPRVSLGNAVV